jgi:hypothetical protein
MNRKLSYTLPFLFAIFTVVTLYQANAARLDPGSMIMPAILGLLVAGLFLGLSWLCKWTAPAAPLVAGITTGVFLCWYTLTWPVSVFALVGVAVCLAIMAIKRTRISQIKVYTKHFSNIIVYGLAAAILVSGIGAGISDAGKIEAQSNDGPYSYTPGQPNIYFIVPDRFPSPAAMRESGIDPDQFVDDLRELGFYVNEDQVSEDPYTWDWPDELYTTRTMRYFTSVLNGGTAIPMDIPYQDSRNKIRNNQAFTWLHDKGYRIINVPSWFMETSSFPAQDETYPFKDVTLLERFFHNELGAAYFERTILNGLNVRYFESLGSQRAVERSRIEYQRARILGVANSGESSTFLISHILYPHEPYLYGDPSASIPDQYYTNIRSAMVYITDLAAGIRSADPTATVIIQSDEGMAYRTPPELNYDLSPVQWSGVLTAWYMPDTDFTILDTIPHTGILDIVVDTIYSGEKRSK